MWWLADILPAKRAGDNVYSGAQISFFADIALCSGFDMGCICISTFVRTVACSYACYKQDIHDVEVE